MALNFPQHPDIPLSAPPLAEVICQVRFPPILRIVREEPSDFQERVRDRFPLLEVEQGVVVKFPRRPAAARLPLRFRRVSSVLAAQTGRRSSLSLSTSLRSRPNTTPIGRILQRIWNWHRRLWKRSIALPMPSASGCATSTGLHRRALVVLRWAKCLHCSGLS